MEELHLAEIELHAHQAASLVQPYAALRAQVQKEKTDIGVEFEKQRRELICTIDEAADTLSKLEAKDTELVAARDGLRHLEILRQEDAAVIQKITLDGEILKGVLREKDAELAAANSKLVRYGRAAELSFHNAVE
ncbi:hypothetical protein K1719_042063 [Acacia pycnantha]|nr:hypothetical protein K1719_042063 [Acacia pycnantha]